MQMKLQVVKNICCFRARLFYFLIAKCFIIFSQVLRSLAHSLTHSVREKNVYDLVLRAQKSSRSQVEQNGKLHPLPRMRSVEVSAWNHDKVFYAFVSGYENNKNIFITSTNT